MNLYFELAKKPVFSLKDVEPLYSGNKNSAASGLQRLIKCGRTINIRRGMYTCVSAETGAPIANKYQVASFISDTSCVSHHSALEYHGITDQVFNEIYVADVKPFSEFSFDGITFKYVKSYFMDGVIKTVFNGGVKVTDIERTVVDIIKDIDRIAGIEEVLDNISCIKRLSDKKILKYLNLYNNQFLYQKTGWIFSELFDKFQFSDAFFEECKAHIGKSKRYFTTDKRTDRCYSKEWGLIVPANALKIKNGVFEDADI